MDAGSTAPRIKSKTWGIEKGPQEPRDPGSASAQKLFKEVLCESRAVLRERRPSSLTGPLLQTEFLPQFFQSLCGSSCSAGDPYLQREERGKKLLESQALEASGKRAYRKERTRGLSPEELRELWT